LSPSNACSLLEQCLGFDETAPADICACYIGDHATAVLASESFNRASEAVIYRIAELETLSVGEIDFFEACVAWARARGGNDTEKLRLHLSPVLDLIRFPTMSPEDFARRVVPLNILSDSEACNVYKYFTCPEKPMKRFIAVKRNNQQRTVLLKQRPTMASQITGKIQW
jgi:BTB And C-terminal Kelch